MSETLINLPNALPTASPLLGEQPPAQLKPAQLQETRVPALAQPDSKEADRIAEGRAAARRLGLPEALADLDPREMVDLSRTSARYRLLSQTPHLNAWLNEGNNAVLAGDDVETLAAWEQVNRYGKELGAYFPKLDWAIDPARAFMAGASDFVAFGLQGSGHFLESAAAGAKKTEARPGFELEPLGALAPFSGHGFVSEEDYTVFQDTTGAIGSALVEAGDVAEDFSTWIDVPVEERGFVEDVMGGLGQVAAGVALFMLGPIGKASVAVAAFGQGVELQRRHQISLGIDPESAEAHVGQFLGGLTSFVTERLSIAALTKRLPSLDAYLGRVLAGTVKGGTVETTQEVIEGIIHRVILNNTVEENLDLFEGIERDAQVAAGAGSLYGFLRELLTLGKASRPSLSRAPGPGEDAPVIASKNSLAQKSKLAKRSPDAFRDYVGRVSVGSGTEHLYVSAEAFLEYFRSKDVLLRSIAQDLGLSAGQVIRAAQAGSQIAIPLEAYASVLAASPHGRWFEENASFSPQSARGAAAESATATAKQLRDREEVFLQSETEELAALEAEMTRQFTEAGLPPEVAQQTVQPLVAFFRTLGHRTGVSAMETFQAVGGIEVRGEATEVPGVENSHLDGRTDDGGIQFATVDTLPPLIYKQESRDDKGGKAKTRIFEQSQTDLESSYRDLLDDPTAMPTTRDFIDGEIYGLMDLPRFVAQYIYGRSEGTRVPEVRFQLGRINEASLSDAIKVEPAFGGVSPRVTISNRSLAHVQVRREQELPHLLAILPQLLREQAEAVRIKEPARVILARRIRLDDGSKEGKASNQQVIVEAVPTRDGIEVVSMQTINDKGLERRRRQARNLDDTSADGGGGQSPRHIGAEAPHAEAVNPVVPSAQPNMALTPADVKAGNLPEIDLRKTHEERTGGILRGYATIPFSGLQPDNPAIIFLTKDHDFSTALHELGHTFLEIQLATLKENPNTNGLKDDLEAVKVWWRGSTNAIAAEAGVSQAEVESLLAGNLLANTARAVGACLRSLSAGRQGAVGRATAELSALQGLADRDLTPAGGAGRDPLAGGARRL